ncbi:hypothetical protein [Luteibacter sp. dw_328]|uniref:hypothetical protein n=1 Tax=Luteibacter sp. dw_328 TaxID=2719796 RepID=UPI001BD39E3E|nr:hypothetical protein [Luteibacter sp. dw_328]
MTGDATSLAGVTFFTTGAGADAALLTGAAVVFLAAAAVTAGAAAFVGAAETAFLAGAFATGFVSGFAAAFVVGLVATLGAALTGSALAGAFLAATLATGFAGTLFTGADFTGAPFFGAVLAEVFVAGLAAALTAVFAGVFVFTTAVAVLALLTSPAPPFLAAPLAVAELRAIFAISFTSVAVAAGCYSPDALAQQPIFWDTVGWLTPVDPGLKSDPPPTIPSVPL